MASGTIGSPAYEGVGANTFMAKPRIHALADLEPLWEITMVDCPASSLAHSAAREPWTTDGTRNRARVDGEVPVGLDIDEDGAPGDADQAGELVVGDRCYRRDGVRMRPR